MVAALQTPHLHPTPRIILKTGVSSPEAKMGIKHLPTSPSKKTGTPKRPLPTQGTPSKQASQPQPGLSARTRQKQQGTVSTTPSSFASPAKPPTQPMTTQPALPLQQYPSNVLLQHLPNKQICLIDLAWSSFPLPPSIAARAWPLRLIHDSEAYTTSLSTETLCSTPSDFRSSILNPEFCPVEDHYGLVMTSLRTFGLEREELVKTIVVYMQSGRLNSAMHNGGIYNFDRSVSLLSLASRNAMVRVVELILMEMDREFLSNPNTPTQQGHQKEPIDLTASQLDTISRIYDPRVWKWINIWTISIFCTPKGQRIESKAAVEDCMQMQGECGEGSSILQRIIADWFRENPNPMRSKREGELSKLRAMRPKRARGDGMKRSPSVLSNATTRTPGTDQGTPGAGMGRVRELQNEMSPTPKPRSKPGEGQTCEGEDGQTEQGFSEDESGSERDGEGETPDGKKSRRGRKKRKAPGIHYLLLDQTPL